MPSKMKRTKKPRKPKTSKGIHGGGGKVSLTALQLVLMNKGMMQVKSKPKPAPAFDQKD